MRSVRGFGCAECGAGGPALRGEDFVTEARGVVGPGCVLRVVGYAGAAVGGVLVVILSYCLRETEWGGENVLFRRCETHCFGRTVEQRGEDCVFWRYCTSFGVGDGNFGGCRARAANRNLGVRDSTPLWGRCTYLPPQCSPNKIRLLSLLRAVQLSDTESHRSKTAFISTDSQH